LEVPVLSGLRTAVVVPTLSALLLTPVLADAQRRAVQRVPPARSTVAVPATAGRVYAPYRGAYYRPFYAPYYRAYYNPFFYGSFVGFGVGFGLGYGYPYYGGYPYAYGGYPYGYGYPYAPYGPYGAYPYYGGGYYDGSAAMHLQVTPRETEVFIDGYFAGNVDQFDGTFQRLHLQPGQHELQLYLPGHRIFEQRVYLQPSGTFNVRHAMEPLGAGEPEPEKPAARTPPGPPSPPPTNGSTSSSRRPPARTVASRPDYRGEDRNSVSVAPSDFGTLSLRVQPGDATITIDGEQKHAPSDNDNLLVQLGSGVHNIQIRKDGYRAYITDVTVRRGETTPLKVAMTKQ
jgi:hypothetical protein